MKIRYILVLLLVSMPLNAQKELSLDECIQYAWNNNLNIKNSIIDQQLAKEDYTQAIGAFIPRGNAMARVGKRSGKSSIDPITNNPTNETFKEGYMELGATLSLFEGFTRINQLKLSKLTKQKKEWEVEDRKNQLAFDVMDSYYKLLLENQLLNLANQQCELSEKYLYQMERFVELGLKSESELQEVKARRNGDLYQVTSRSKSCDLTLIYLTQLLNMQTSDSLEIIDINNIEHINSALIPTTTDLYDRSSSVLPSFKMLKLSEEEAEKELAISRGQFLPKIYSEFAIHSRYKDTYYSRSQLSDNFGRYIGVGITIPISTGLERITAVRKKKLNKQRVANEVNWTKQQLYKEMDETILSIRSSMDEHRHALAQVEAETLVMKESKRKWEEGLISIFQLMETRNRFINAKAELARVYYQYEMNRRMLNYFETGSFITNK